jgi:hypothetical protein
LSAVTGLVSPDKDARLADPQVSVDRITRTAFVATNPVVVHDSCRLQVIVRVQAVDWLSGPCSVNIPTVKLNLVTSPPGECDQHSVYPPNDVPAVGMPKPYTLWDPAFITCVAEKPVMLAKDGDNPHESVDAINLTWFEDANPTPLSCKLHDAVSVHCVAPVKGPEIWNEPTSNK